MHQTSLYNSDNVSAPPAPLDPLETPVNAATGSCSEQEFPAASGLIDTHRHSGWRHRRQLIYDAYTSLAVRHSRVEAFRSCGSGWWILRSKTDSEQFRRVPDYCHDRWCVPCSRMRQATIRHNLAQHLGDHPHRFLTLTIRHHQEPLRDLIHKLYDSFRRLRQRPIWREHVTGGVAFLELTYNSTTHSWHPHLHCILEGSYLHRPELSRIWLSVTGDSHNVDIKLVRDRLAVVDYISKYATAPLPASVIHQADALREAIMVLKGRRMLITFGGWRAWHLARPPENHDWSMYCHSNELALADADSEPDKHNVQSMLHTADPTTGIFYVHFDDIPP